MLVNKNDQPFYRKKRSFCLNGRLITLDQPVVMGILNLTPDSFFDGGRYGSEPAVLNRVEQMLAEGAFILDVGAVSTRPGAAEVSERDELERLLKPLASIRQHFPEVTLSVDTWRSEVVRQIVDVAGDVIVNDISGGKMDPQMFAMVARLGLPYLLMHIQGTPQTMQHNPVYSNVVGEVIRELSESVNQLKLLGVQDILLDPGFGFGKLAVHNYELLNRLDAFRLFELPLVAGLSRKTMIWKQLGITPEDSLNGTTVLNTLALLGGADILRVHDVKEALEAIRLVGQLK
ncbi:MAG: dihydropteroate synthase [Marinilabiliales bacterium]|nr:dihydropteroate synthase [Marinilabiliales bacterium]